MVLSEIATLQEIETHWNIIDLMDANEALDIKAEQEEYEMDKAKK